MPRSPSPSGSDMSCAKTAGLSDEEEAKIFPGTEQLVSGGDTAHHGFEEDKFSAVRESMEEAEKIQKAFLSELDLMPFIPPAFRFVASKGGTVLHGSEEESKATRRAKKMILTGPDLQWWVAELLRTDKLVSADKKNQLGRTLAAEVDSHVAPSSGTQPPPIPSFPPRPKDDTPQQIRNWRKECKRIMKEHEKVLLSSDSDNNYPTLRALEVQGTTNSVQDWRSKQAVLAAARSIVSVTPVSKDGPAGPQCTGFILRRYAHSGFVFSVLVTCSAVLCKAGRKLDPAPKFSVGLPDKKTVLEAHLLYFNDHFDIALLLLPFDLSMDIPCLGCCPDYNQEVFVLGRDKDASLRVEHGVISWAEESDYMGCDYYMFLDGEVPEGGTGGPVIDHDGVFRGMAFKLSPMPAVLSISTIMTCFEMFMHFRRIARPMLHLSLRTVASVDVDLLECLSSHNIKSGYIVESVHGNTPAQGCMICRGDVIVSLNGRNMLTLPKLEDYLLSLGWENLINKVSTINIKLEVRDLKRGDMRSTIMPVGFCSTPEPV